MKLALYLPNFRDEVTVKELEDLTAAGRGTRLRLGLDAGSDRRSRGLRSRGAAVNSFGMMDGFPEGPAGLGPWSVVPGLAADPVAGGQDLEGPDQDEHHDTRTGLPACWRPR